MKKIIINVTVLIVMALVVFGIWRALPDKSSYKKAAYEHCLKSEEGDNPEQLKQYSCQK